MSKPGIDMEEFETAREDFLALLARLAPIPEGELDYLREQCRPARYRRGEDLLTAGEAAQKLWYLHRGIVRFFYVSEAGREFNKAFARRGEIIGPLVAVVTGEPAGFSIQALAPTQSVAIPAKLLPRLFDRHPCWDRVGRVLAEQAAVRKEIREREFLQDDPYRRYLQFLERYPGIEADIPQKQIAAYIGVSEVALSRLLRRVRDGTGANS